MTSGAILNSEIEFLLREELRDVTTYNVIIQAIASGSTTLSEITNKALLKNTGTTNAYLKALLDVGLIEKEFPVNIALKEQGNANRGYYKLTDDFNRFWFSFIVPNLSLIDSGDKDGVWLYDIEPNLSDFASSIFERISQNYLLQMQINREWPFRIRKIGRWYGKSTLRDNEHPKKYRTVETEIAVIATNLEGNRFIVCECKLKNSLFRYSEFKQTKNKAIPLMNRGIVNYILFSGSNFDENLLEESKTNPNLKLVTLEELINNI